MVSGNSTVVFGGGIYNSDFGTLTVTNSTISGNSADFNSDGKIDILWQHEGGYLAVWYMDGAAVAGYEYLNPDHVADTNWKMIGYLTARQLQHQGG